MYMRDTLTDTTYKQGQKIDELAQTVETYTKSMTEMYQKLQQNPISVPHLSQTPSKSIFGPYIEDLEEDG